MSFKGKKNIYLCQVCGHGFVSQDADEGTTPFMSPCLNCPAMAHSMMYAAPQEMLADMEPAVIWYLPPFIERARLSDSVRAHIQNGGLIRRVVGDGPAPSPAVKFRDKSKKLFRQ